MRRLGLDVQTQPGPIAPEARRTLSRWRTPAGPEAEAVNLVGTLPGRDRAAPAVLLMAHHDSVAGSPGVADDAAGVAAILETVRALRAGPPPARDVVVLFTDAEELDSSGAERFFASPLARRVGVVVNLEARGGGGRALMFETGAGDGPMMRLFGRSVAAPTANSAAVMVYRLLPNATDFTAARRRGLAGFNFAFLGRPALYHSPAATADAVDLGSVQHLGDQVLDLTRALASAQELPPRGADAVYGDVLGFRMLIYPAAAGWAVLAAAVALFAFAARRAAKARAVAWRGVAAGAGQAAGFALVCAALLEVANRLSGSGRAAEYYDRLAAIPRLEVQALLVALACFCLLAAARSRRNDPWGLWLGFAAWAGLAAVAQQAFAPAAGPALAWPLTAAGLAAAVAALVDPRLEAGAARLVLVLGAVVGGAHVLALAHPAFLAVGADLAPAMAGFAALFALGFAPLLDGLAGRRLPIVAAAVLLAGAFAVALWVRLDPPAPTAPAYVQVSR